MVLGCLWQASNWLLDSYESFYFYREFKLLEPNKKKIFLKLPILIGSFMANKILFRDGKYMCSTVVYEAEMESNQFNVNVTFFFTISIYPNLLFKRP